MRLKKTVSFAAKVVTSGALFAILAMYTYLKLWGAPYVGFHLRLPSGEISSLCVQASSTPTLQAGDKLLQAGPVTMDEYNTDLRTPLFAPMQVGEVVSLRIQRGEQEIVIPWLISSPTWCEIFDRLPMLWLPYVFWLIGTAALFLIKPGDTSEYLLVAFNYLTAVWLVTGIVSNTAYWHSAVIMRMAVWLCVPVYWHLHWHFPMSLGRLSPPLIGGLYLIAGALAVAEWFQKLPISLYLLAFLLAILGSVVLLVVHAIRRPEQRRDLMLLALAVMIAVIPLLSLGNSKLFGNIAWLSVGSLLTFPFIPLAYFYAMYRRQRGGLAPRVNRIVALILFGSLLFGAAALLVAGIVLLGGLQITVADLIAPMVVTGLITAVGYQGFQKWVERKLLGIPVPPLHLLEHYSTRIVTSLSLERLVQIVRDEVFPSLLIRQAALLRLDDGGNLTPILTLGVTEAQLPSPSDMPDILSQAGMVRSRSLGHDQSTPYAWVRLVFPLQVEERNVGVCLLGSRDVDNVYAATEIPALQALVNQTALALVNIEQTERLNALYQADIERREVERIRLARELHDDVLRQMAMLTLNVDEPTEQFKQAYESAATHIRQMISGLRPTMLSYGLEGALQELIDDAISQKGEVTLEMDVHAEKDVRYPPDVELHLFRIVQQACQNALKHAQASNIRLTGQLEAERVDLAVSDNGKGFEASEQLDFNELLARKHFGLAGMYERAALVGAKIHIKSVDRQGTEIRVQWEKGKREEL